jgi:putative ABC transport system substrate-binding protein
MNKTFFAFVLSSMYLALGFTAAQTQGRVPRIGFLAPTQAPSSFYRVFREGLESLGYTENKNVILEFRSADTRSSLTAAAIELVQQKVDVIVTPGRAAGAAKRATRTTPVPIIFSYSGDPVEAGFVQSLARPGGNMTGITWLSFELVGKRLELLKEAWPRISRVAVLANPGHPGEQLELQETQTIARQLGLNLQYHQLRAPAEVETVLDGAIKHDPNAMLVFPDSLTLAHHRRLAQFAENQRLPSMYGWKEYVEVGGLMSYGPAREETLRRVAVYVDKILKGRKPTDLPVERPTKLELVINLKTANQIGVTITPNVLARADRVIR